jgi:hypothetical protein
MSIKVSMQYDGEVTMIKEYDENDLPTYMWIFEFAGGRMIFDTTSHDEIGMKLNKIIEDSSDVTVAIRDGELIDVWPLGGDR